MRKKKGYLLGGAALLLSAAAICIPSAYAANPADPEKSCSLTLQAAGTGEVAEELKACEIPVLFYRMASLSPEGVYTAEASFEALGLTDEIIKEGKWEEIIPQAAEIAQNLTPDRELLLTEGTVKAEDLTAGIYLIVPLDTVGELHSYQFQPFMTALPDNMSFHTEEGEDSWIYDVEAALKGEQKSRNGSLKITKNLSSFCDLLQETTFVFDVEGTDRQGRNVYSNVVSISFSQAGIKEAVVEDIPAGTNVTVTEIYSGASYTLTSDAQQTAVITAEEVQNVLFENEYDDHLTGSYGVTNHFDYSEEEGWQWTQISAKGAEQ